MKGDDPDLLPADPLVPVFFPRSSVADASVGNVLVDSCLQLALRLTKMALSVACYCWRTRTSARREGRPASLPSPTAEGRWIKILWWAPPTGSLVVPGDPAERRIPMKRFYARGSWTWLALVVLGTAAPCAWADSSYSTVVLADMPLGYWRLGDSAPILPAADASGNGYAGTYNGGVTVGQSGAINGDPDT